MHAATVFAKMWLRALAAALHADLWLQPLRAGRAAARAPAGAKKLAAAHHTQHFQRLLPRGSS